MSNGKEVGEFFGSNNNKNISEISKKFDLIPIEKRKDSIVDINDAISAMLEERPDPESLLAALLDPSKIKELTAYPRAYECMYQLPFSKHTLYLKMEYIDNECILSYNLNEGDWVIWNGDSIQYNDILRNKFKLGGVFYDELANKFITRTITNFREDGLWYFVNLSKGVKK